MSTKIISDGRIYGSVVFVSGSKAVTGSFIKTTSTIHSAFVISSANLYLGYESLGAGTVTLRVSSGTTTDTVNWMVLN